MCYAFLFALGLLSIFWPEFSLQMEEHLIREQFRAVAMGKARINAKDLKQVLGQGPWGKMSKKTGEIVEVLHRRQSHG